MSDSVGFVPVWLVLVLVIAEIVSVLFWLGLAGYVIVLVIVWIVSDSVGFCSGMHELRLVLDNNQAENQPNPRTNPH